MLSELIHPFGTSGVQMATLAHKITAEEAADPDRVKVVFAEDGRALYFSRSSIPYHRNPQAHHYYGHIGIYAFRMKTLKKFVALSPSRLEITEKLEQLRLLENNLPIHIVLTEHRSIGVDRPEDIRTVSEIISAKKND
jgi:3-deoxy-manno-octulosonate cytidylyltransferase (CMP-KDO synthetase)